MKRSKKTFVMGEGKRGNRKSLIASCCYGMHIFASNIIRRNFILI
jgi:hypothetical protein